MKLHIAAVLVGAVLILSVSVQAHHSAATFYFMERTAEITGVVKELRLINPHIRLVLDVIGENGQIEEWTVDGPNATGLRNRGWETTTLEVGETVTVVGHPARNPNARGLNGDRVIRSDGTIVDLRSTD